MILDTSAVVAIVFKEPGYEALIDKLVETENVAMGAPTVAETGIVLEARLRRDARGLILQLLDEWRVAIVPFGEDHWREAMEAYARFGRGRHRAALNFGDCLTYAVAKLAGQPLLCLGDDFAKTDLPLA
jgi:ribonuclease VapC